VIEIDGAHGEGGGQLVRLAAALSALTGTPLRLANARANRARPGLAPQHLAAVGVLARLCGARCVGLELRSTAFSFEPRRRPEGGELRVDVGTAGSVTLVLQALLPVLLAARAPSRVVVSGGTDVRQAPTWDYLHEVLLRLLGRMGVGVRASVVRRGYYPRGGGEVIVELEPATPQPFAFQKKSGPRRVAGAARVANLPLSIAERMRDAAALALHEGLDMTVEALARDAAAGTGGAITLWAESEAAVLGASRVAERGVRAEALGAAVGSELAADLAAGAALDVHATDQILVYLAMARGRSTFTTRAVSGHARTAIWLLEQFLPVQFSVASEGALRRVSVSPPES
jgi:RNA 3'-terminal phosphate cyclase (ATP)